MRWCATRSNPSGASVAHQPPLPPYRSKFMIKLKLILKFQVLTKLTTPTNTVLPSTVSTSGPPESPWHTPKVFRIALVHNLDVGTKSVQGSILSRHSEWLIANLLARWSWFGTVRLLSTKPNIFSNYYFNSAKYDIEILPHPETVTVAPPWVKCVAIGMILTDQLSIANFSLVRINATLYR